VVRAPTERWDGNRGEAFAAGTQGDGPALLTLRRSLAVVFPVYLAGMAGPSSKGSGSTTSMSSKRVDAERLSHLAHENSLRSANRAASHDRALENATVLGAQPPESRLTQMVRTYSMVLRFAPSVA
jgi:hypothetical protein